MGRGNIYGGSRLDILTNKATQQHHAIVISKLTRLQHPAHNKRHRLLDQPSYTPTSQKTTTVRTLRRRAQFFCDSRDSLTVETKHLATVFIKNNYSTDFIERNTKVRPNDSSNNSYTPKATIPYIRGTSETILRPYNIRVAQANPCSL